MVYCRFVMYEVVYFCCFYLFLQLNVLLTAVCCCGLFSISCVWGCYEELKRNTSYHRHGDPICWYMSVHTTIWGFFRKADGSVRYHTGPKNPWSPSMALCSSQLFFFSLSNNSNVRTAAHWNSLVCVVCTQLFWCIRGWVRVSFQLI